MLLEGHGHVRGQDGTRQDGTGQTHRHKDTQTHIANRHTDTQTHANTHTHRHARTHSQTLFATACTPAILTLGEPKADGCTP